MRPASPEWSAIPWVGLIFASAGLALILAFARPSTAATILGYWAVALLLALGVLGWRRRPRRTLLALASALATLVVFDGVARWGELPAGLPTISSMGLRSTSLHHAYPPERTLASAGPGRRRFVFHTNEDGLRTRYTRESFRDRETRIAVLGDSFTFGLGVPEGAPFPERLEALLREREAWREAAVLNAGVVSYSPFLERLQFETVVAGYRPQLVLLVLDATDFADDAFYASQATVRNGRTTFDAGESAGTVAGFRHHGPLWELTKGLRRALLRPWRALFAEPLAPVAPMYRVTAEIGGQRQSDPYFVLRYPLEATRPYLERTLENVRGVARSVENRGARFLLVVTSRYSQWNPAEAPQDPLRARYDVGGPYQDEYLRFFHRAREEVDFPVVDLTPAFARAEEFPLVFENDSHWNERGHQLVARRLAEVIASGGPLAPKPPRSESSGDG